MSKVIGRIDYLTKIGNDGRVAALIAAAEQLERIADALEQKKITYPEARFEFQGDEVRLEDVVNHFLEKLQMESMLAIKPIEKENQ